MHCQKSLLELHGKLKSLLPGSESKISRAANICFHLAASESAGGCGERQREDECVMWSNHIMDPVKKRNSFKVIQPEFILSAQVRLSHLPGAISSVERGCTVRAGSGNCKQQR